MPRPSVRPLRQSVPGLFAALALFIGESTLAAAVPAEGPDPGGACSQDIQTHCSAVDPAGGQVATCLENHADELSAGCRHHRESAQSRTEERKARRQEERQKRKDKRKKS